MAGKENDYEIPVSKRTVDQMMDMLIKENHRLEEENSSLKARTGGDAEGKDGDGRREAVTKELEELVSRYL